MKTNKHTFFSSLGIDECINRLAEVADNRQPQSLSSDSLRPIVIKVKGHEFSLWVSSRYTWFAFHGTLRSYKNGTLVEGVYRLHLFYQVFWLCMFSGVLVLCGVEVLLIPIVPLLIAMFIEFGERPQDWWVLLAAMPILMVIFPLVWVFLTAFVFFLGVVGQREGQDIKRILALLEKTLQARCVESAS
jgi:hypothetical protein